ncbi:MAG: hypothetical protein RLZZ618_4243 [Pseudomonadota bacterium]|jgi:hypothetical protein
MFSLFRNPLVALVLIGMGIFFIFSGHKSSAEVAALRDHGKTADAEITKLEWKEKKRSNADSSYTVHVQFKTESGETVADTLHITAELGRALRNRSVSSVMKVRYLPEAPHTIRAADAPDPTEGQGKAGGFMLLAGIAILAFRFFSRR